MIYGIVGNTSREAIWEPILSLLRWLPGKGIGYVLHPDISEGLQQQYPEEAFASTTTARPDVLLSFGGDGTLLRRAHYANKQGIPLLGINLGRLGFLADVDATEVIQAIESLEKGCYTIEHRLAMSVATGVGRPRAPLQWALNDVVISGAESSGMIAVEVTVDGMKLDSYWADGLIIATPTGSTAYSLSAGGPIVAPGTSALVVTPIASHRLTVRPVVVSGDTIIELRVLESKTPFVLAVDGIRRSLPGGTSVRVQRAPHTVNLVRLSDRHYFQTLRSKLSWGAGPQHQA